MNTLLATGTYKGEHFTDSGLRFMQFNLPGHKGKESAEVPLYVVPNRAAGETFDVFQPGVKLLIGGRLYPNRQDYKMYLVPNQPIQVFGGPVINVVHLAGGVGFINEKTREELLAFSLMCSAPGQTLLNHSWDDSLSFKMVAWHDDARRLEQLIHVGRQMSLEATLRYNTWTSKEGQERGSYQFHVRSGLYSVFGKNKNRQESAEEMPAVRPSVVKLATVTVTDEDKIPM